MKNLKLIALGSMLAAALLASGRAQPAGKAAPEFIPGGQWFNSRPLTVKDLRGKVVIVNIWVYSCINCHNSLPTLKEWYRKYKDQGLEIVGVHTPEFESDKVVGNVTASLKQDGVTWPVFQDNQSKTWDAYNNRYWPSFYLIDRSGNIRELHEGEISSRYPQAIPGLERTLVKLLSEKNSAN